MLSSSSLRALVVAGVLVVSAAQARAAAPSPAPSASPEALRPIGEVVTSSRKPEPIGLTSQPTFVVDRARIEEFGDRTVADALADVPGVNLFSYGGFGAQTNYGIRGSNSAQTLVLVDGIPVTDPTTGAIQLSQFSTAGVQRIEIVESGSSTLYGTSASGGVINIITSVPRGTYLEASAGSFGSRDVRAAGGDGKFGFSFEREVVADAYPYGSFAYGPAATYPAGVRTNAEGDESTGRFSLDVPLVAGFRLRARADASEAYVGVPGPLDFPSTDATQSTSTDSLLVDLVRDGAASSTTISFAASKTRLKFDDLIGQGGESDTDTGRAQVSVRQTFDAKALDGVAGIDLARESGTFSNPVPVTVAGAARAESAAYGVLGVAPFAGARLTAGLRAEDDSPHGSVLAPSFGGTIRSGSLRFSGDLGESFRVPTLEDLYYPGFSNPNLQPEKAQTADATVALDTGRAAFSAGWFDRNGSNFIVLDPTTFLPVNAQHAQSAGVVVTASLKPVAGLSVAASFTNLYRALDVTTGARLPGNPVDQASLEITHPFAAGRFAYGLRWGVVGSDGSDRANVAPLSGEYDAYDRLDAFVRYKLSKDAVLAVRGFNLGNAIYAPIFGYPAPGRSVEVELSTR